MPGDRVLEVWEGGDAAGVPVVLHHVTPSGRLQARMGEEEARRLGVRLLPGEGDLSCKEFKFSTTTLTDGTMLLAAGASS